MDAANKRDDGVVKFESSRPSDRRLLEIILEGAGVATESYNLTGSRSHEAYVLAARPGGWATFYAERGKEVGRREFDSEDAACADLMDRILRDATTRRSQRRWFRSPSSRVRGCIGGPARAK